MISNFSLEKLIIIFFYFLNKSKTTQKQMNNREICYKYVIKLTTLNDHYLVKYVENELRQNPRKYKFTTDPIRPTKFLYNQLNKQQKIIYNALMKTNEDCECPICYEKLGEYNTIRTQCKHLFCKECFSKTINYGFNCPYCRKVITKYEELFVNPVIIELCFRFISYVDDSIVLYNKWMSLNFTIYIKCRHMVH